MVVEDDEPAHDERIERAVADCTATVRYLYEVSVTVLPPRPGTLSPRANNRAERRAMLRHPTTLLRWRPDRSPDDCGSAMALRGLTDRSCRLIGPVGAITTAGTYTSQVDVTPPARKSTTRDNLLSSSEAAEVLGVSGKTVLRWINAGLLPARRIRVGGQYRIERAAVERFKAEQQQEVRPTATKEGRTPPTS